MCKLPSRLLMRVPASGENNLQVGWPAFSGYLKMGGAGSYATKQKICKISKIVKTDLDCDVFLCIIEL